jgi:hypothetical protein
LSTLICSGQITKEEALKELAIPLYEPKELKADKEYVLKKFALSESEFETIMKLPIRRHEDFKMDKLLKEKYMNLLKRTEPFRNALKKIVSK